MKNIKIFEGFSDSFNKKIKDFKQSVMDEFKEDVDMCLHYLLDEYKHKYELSINNDPIYHNIKDGISLKYIITIEKDKMDIPSLSDELKSSINHLIDLDVNFVIQISNESDSGSRSTEGLDKIMSNGNREPINMVDVLMSKIKSDG